MDIPVRVVNGQLTCLKENHNGPVKMILMDDSVPLYHRLLCYKCFESSRYVSKYINIEEAQGLIEEKLCQLNNNQEEQKNQILQDLSDFQNKIMNIRSRVVQWIDEILRISELWIQDFKNIGKKKDVNNFIENLQLLSQDTKYDLDYLNKSNQSHSTKISMLLQKLMVQNDYLDCQNFLNSIVKIKFEEVLKSDLKKEMDVKKVQLMNVFKQKEGSITIVFNNQGSIMVSGSNNDIQVWNFMQGKLVEMKRLTGHTNLVSCLVYSKRHNWFASGSRDNTIRGWKENGNNWISSLPGKQHQNYIQCILLNANEDQLISCSQDQTIKVWKVDYLQNQLGFYYTLAIKHTNTVHCLSLNGSETTLVSCGGDKKIILWSQQNEKWQYQSELLMEDIGYRICFINENQIIWQQMSKGIIHFLESNQGKLVKKPELNITLNKEQGDYALFPTIKNNKKQVIIHKHNRYVYILKQHNNGQLMIVSDPIDCNHGGISGNLTEDGEYLTIWNEVTKEFKIYKIHYV